MVLSAFRIPKLAFEGGFGFGKGLLFPFLKQFNLVVLGLGNEFFFFSFLIFPKLTYNCCDSAYGWQRGKKFKISMYNVVGRFMNTRNKIIRLQYKYYNKAFSHLQR